MSEPYLGEIRMFGGSFAPRGWALCDGSTLAIAQNDALFTLIGTTYGGDGQETFALPDLQGRAPVHQGGNFVLGEKVGVEKVTLTTQQIPVHNHALVGSTDPGTDPNPQDAILATQNVIKAFAIDAPDAPLNGQSVQPTGGSQPHENMQPFLCITFILALSGVFPNQN